MNKLVTKSLLLFSFLVSFSPAFSMEVHEEYRPPAMVQKGNGDVIRVSPNGDIEQVFLDENGGVIDTELMDNTLRNDKITQMVSYGDNSLVMITESNRLLVKNGRHNLNVIGTGWNIKNMAIIGDTLFVLSPAGHLSSKNLATRAHQELLPRGSWVFVTHMIAVDNSLVLLANDGNLFRASIENLRNLEKIGSGWGPATKILSVQNSLMFIKTGKDYLFTKDLVSGRLVESGRFRQGKTIANFRVFDFDGFVAVNFTTAVQSILASNAHNRYLVPDEELELFEAQVQSLPEGKLDLDVIWGLKKQAFFTRAHYRAAENLVLTGRLDELFATLANYECFVTPDWATHFPMLLNDDGELFRDPVVIVSGLGVVAGLAVGDTIERTRADELLIEHVHLVTYKNVVLQDLIIALEKIGTEAVLRDELNNARSKLREKLTEPCQDFLDFELMVRAVILPTGQSASQQSILDLARGGNVFQCPFSRNNVLMTRVIPNTNLQNFINSL